MPDLLKVIADSVSDDFVEATIYVLCCTKKLSCETVKQSKSEANAPHRNGFFL
jgi:hypothetical protein